MPVSNTLRDTLIHNAISPKIMKVFISWSGKVSQDVALALKDWLPSVIQCVEAFVSAADVDKGTNWHLRISKELESTDFGIICLTKSNIKAPWVNFEAGALSKRMESSRVCSVLFKMEHSDMTNNSPFVHFQNTLINRDDIYKLLQSINRACDTNALDDSSLQKSFNVWWPHLETKIVAINDPELGTAPIELIDKFAQKDTKPEILEEILEIVRSQQRLLTSPSEFLPPEYLNKVFSTKEFVRYADGAISLARIQDIQSLSFLAITKISDFYKASDQVSVEPVGTEARALSPKFRELTEEQKECLNEIQVALTKIRLISTGFTRLPILPPPI